MRYLLFTGTTPRVFAGGVGFKPGQEPRPIEDDELAGRLLTTGFFKEVEAPPPPSAKSETTTKKRKKEVQ